MQWGHLVNLIFLYWDCFNLNTIIRLHTQVPPILQGLNVSSLCIYLKDGENIHNLWKQNQAYKNDYNYDYWKRS